MKPSVISNGNGNGNPQQPQQQQQYHHQPTAGVNAGTNPAGSHIPYQQQQDPSTTSNVRGQFPHFTQGFGLDPDMDDIFSDARIRSRLPRMRDPFGTFGTRKPCGIDSNFDPYSDIFEDGADDFFSGFGRRRNPHDFFDFPEEFRQYIPDGFGVPRSGSGASVRTHQVHPAYQQHQPPTNEHLGNTSHPQYAPQSPQYDNVPTPQSPKPNLCDASIQTDEDLTDGAAIDNQHQTKSSSGPKLNKKYSQENEENRGPRSQSAPPHQNEEIPQPPPDEEPVYVSSATFSTSAPQSQAKYPKTKSQGTNGMPPQPPQRQPQSFYLHNPNQGQTRQWPPPPQPQSPQQPYAPEPQTPGGTIIRTIPIFVEGRKDPIYNEHKEIPGQTTPVTQQQPPQFPQPQYQPGQNQGPQYGKPPSYQKPPSYTVPPKTGSQQPQQTQNQQSQYQQAPHQQTTYQQTPHKPAQQQTHPTLDINQPTPEQFDVPPQTPQTMDCINKIQNIQRDVLHLMGEVESFKGFKNDKDYMYLDEMLTRNLLKLDTIDTNGKDSIRLARKEAIRCIQASINVLEAKADENARKTGKFEIRHNSIEEEPAAEENEQNSEKRIQEENPNVLNDKTVIPLPPPPEHKEDKPFANADIKKSNSTTVNKSPSQTSTDKLSNSDVTKKSEESIPASATDENQEQNTTEKVPSKSKIPVKGTSPTKDLSSTELNREKARSQSKSPSKSPAKSAAKEGAKKKIIKKIKKLTKKDSKDDGDGEIEKSEKTNEENDKSLAPPESNEEATTEEGKPLTDVTEKKE